MSSDPRTWTWRAAPLDSSTGQALSLPYLDMEGGSTGQLHWTGPLTALPGHGGRLHWTAPLDRLSHCLTWTWRAAPLDSSTGQALSLPYLDMEGGSTGQLHWTGSLTALPGHGGRLHWTAPLDRLSHCLTWTWRAAPLDSSTGQALSLPYLDMEGGSAGQALSLPYLDMEGGSTGQLYWTGSLTALPGHGGRLHWTAPLDRPSHCLTWTWRAAPLDSSTGQALSLPYLDMEGGSTGQLHWTGPLTALPGHGGRLHWTAPLDRLSHCLTWTWRAAPLDSSTGQALSLPYLDMEGGSTGQLYWTGSLTALPGHGGRLHWTAPLDRLSHCLTWTWRAAPLDSSTGQALSLPYLDMEGGSTGQLYWTGSLTALPGHGGRLHWTAPLDRLSHCLTWTWRAAPLDSSTGQALSLPYLDMEGGSTGQLHWTGSLTALPGHGGRLHWTAPLDRLSHCLTWTWRAAPLDSSTGQALSLPYLDMEGGSTGQLHWTGSLTALPGHGGRLHWTAPLDRLSHCLTWTWRAAPLDSSTGQALSLPYLDMEGGSAGQLHWTGSLTAVPGHGGRLHWTAPLDRPSHCRTWTWRAAPLDSRRVTGDGRWISVGVRTPSRLSLLPWLRELLQQIVQGCNAIQQSIINIIQSAGLIWQCITLSYQTDISTCDEHIRESVHTPLSVPSPMFDVAPSVCGSVQVPVCGVCAESHV